MNNMMQKIRKLKQENKNLKESKNLLQEKNEVVNLLKLKNEELTNELPTNELSRDKLEEKIAILEKSISDKEDVMTTLNEDCEMKLEKKMFETEILSEEIRKLKEYVKELEENLEKRVTEFN
ncbi:uncharacterized protein LOC123315943 [Coccinella septempunctata]|uniref:uncharacterized protein LOC123315943 n=1 Tax=Coccinella septempunctata TaxID=41139 RepID=UPI001D095267|nr:uncharacterized protein LOC123315943 [Coccinella septempunctata]